MEQPLLLLFDDHMTHVSLGVLQKALEGDIIIVKLPPHVMDMLQPLDVSCFGPLKRKWEMRLQEQVNLLCKIWREGLKPDNIISGFASTG